MVTFHMMPYPHGTLHSPLIIKDRGSHARESDELWVVMTTITIPNPGPFSFSNLVDSYSLRNIMKSKVPDGAFR